MSKNTAIVVGAIVVVGGIGAYLYWKNKRRVIVAPANTTTNQQNNSGAGSVGQVVDSVTEAWNDLSNLWN